MEKSLALQIIEAAFQFVLLPLIIWAIKEVSASLKERSKNEKVKKYVDLVGEVVANAVQTVSQTYVDALKEEDKFDAEAQRAAFDKAMTIVKAQLTDDAANVLEEAFGDVNTYLSAKIEAAVHTNKLIF